MSQTGKNIERCTGLVIIEYPIVDIHLHTFVYRLAQIFLVCRESHRRRQCNIAEQIGCRCPVKVGPKRNPIYHGEVDSNITVILLLPLQVVISYTHKYGSHIAIVGTVGNIVVGRYGLIGIEILRTGISQRCPQFAVIDEIYGLHKTLFMQIPTNTYRPEISPALVGSELRRTIEAI